MLKYIIPVLFTAFYGVTQSSAQIVKPDTLGGYKLVWADEFNYKGAPDSSNWSYERGFERNEEAQWYQPENAWCENGLLIIEARRETKTNPNYTPGSDEWRKNREQAYYTSSSIKTRRKQSWQYGRFVMRGKIDISNGMWPAWWTLGNKGRWPATGEIDIMEFYRKKLLANMVCLGENNKDEWASQTRNIDSLGGKNWASRFHIWRMDWDEKTIALYVDDMLMLNVDVDKMVNKDGTGINPFRQPHYMLLNLAIGGQQGGDPSNTTFPKRFEVDYVRIYQKSK
ncbi:glycoside hydrolase family 16 protein [Mucilaginibacter aquatilis]|uniref:Family 16 glycosylhydrolase n=1 Tax=Mucilaginibacter aquatilis TaxID=1517760 RepID=A0A6I4I9M4_9SPHI|nr:glycoside hydrolase family 16 protein [Mucilaginibacter aquatilis]MVN91752.1 family 16 glycosylhydrolase [Mucilaginibacter aquatilis]